MFSRKSYITKERPVSGLSFKDENGDPQPSKTEQHHRQRCNVNTILKQYDKTGLITHVNRAKAQYGDFSEVNEYQESLNIVVSAQNAFNALPSDVRERFGNNPGLFFEFATNPDNAEKMVELGLAEKRPEKVIPKVEVINPQQVEKPKDDVK